MGPLLWFGLALLCCVQAQAQDTEHHSRRHRHSSDSAEADSESGESAHERRKRKREERARRKAEEARGESGAPADDSAHRTTPLDPRNTSSEASAGAVTEPNAAEPAPPAAPEPPAFPPVVYVPRMADGPAPYAAREVMDGEGALDVKRLPPPATLDFASATPEQLRKLDGRMGLTLEEMQAGDFCQALRTASRVPMRSWVTREHQREILVMVGLFVAALLMAFGFNSRAMRAIAPMVPFLACLYVGYDMMARADSRVDSIAKGLRACSATLDEGKIEQPEVVREHFELLTRVRDNITAAYERENRLVARVMDEYRM